MGVGEYILYCLNDMRSVIMDVMGPGKGLSIRSILIAGARKERRNGGGRKKKEEGR